MNDETTNSKTDSIVRIIKQVNGWYVDIYDRELHFANKGFVFNDLDDMLKFLKQHCDIVEYESKK